MDKIQVRDREFTISIPEAKILQRVSEVARQIQHDLKDEHPLFISVLNGSFVFAADLLRALDMPCEVTFVRVASYEGMGSTGKVKQLMGLKENIEGRTVVVVEDIIDSGLTMKQMLETLRQQGPKDIRIAPCL